MHIAILFYADTLEAMGNPQTIKGRSIANHDFILALARFRPEWTITLIVSSYAEKDYVLQQFQSLTQKINLVILSDLKNFLTENHIDILHILSPNLYRCLYVRNSLADYHIPVSGLTHSLGHDPFLEHIQLNLRFKPDSTDFLICTTPTAKEVIGRMQQVFLDSDPQLLPFKTKVIPLGIDVSKFFTPSKINIRQTLNIGNQENILLYLGRFSYFTKVDLLPLLLIFKKALGQSSKKLHLILAGATGDEKYTELLNQAIEDYGLKGLVSIVPNPTEDLKMALYQGSDLFLALNDNYQETFGLSVLEAAASSLPVIASDWDGYRALIKQGQTGYLIKTLGAPHIDFLQEVAPLQLDSLNHVAFSQAIATDFEDYAKAICDLIDDEPKREQFSQAALIHAKLYDWEYIINQYDELWSFMARQAQLKNKKEAPAQVVLDYCKVFANYSTNQISGTTQFLISDLGGECLKGQIPLRVYDVVSTFIDTSLVQQILQYLQKPVSVKNTIDHFQKETTVIHYHLLWLYKYGFVTIPE